MRERVLEGEIQRQSPIRELRPIGGTTSTGRPNFRIESDQVMMGKVFVVSKRLVKLMKSSSWLRYGRKLGMLQRDFEVVNQEI